MAKIYITIYFVISVDTIYSDIDMNIKKSSEKLPRTPIMDVCNYKRLKNEFAKYIISPIKLYNIL